VPTLAVIGPYRFSFFSVDRNEPAHVHVWRDDSSAKFWLNPVALAYSKGFSTKEVHRIQTLVIEYQQPWLEKWNGYFGR